MMLQGMTTTGISRTKRILALMLSMMTCIICLQGCSRPTKIEVDNAAFDQAIEYWAVNDYENVEKYLLQAREELAVAQSDNSLHIAMVNQKLGAIYFIIAQYDKSYEYSMSAYTAFNNQLGKNDENTINAQYYMCLSKLYSGDNEKGYSDFLDMIHNEKDNHRKVILLGQFANHCVSVNNYFLAEKLYLQILEWYQKNDKKDRDRCIIDMNMGIYAKNCGEYESAIAFLNIALEIHAGYTDNEDLDLALIFLHLADVHLKSQNFDEAMRYSSKAIDIYTKLTGATSKDTANCYLNVAEIYLRIGMYDEAIRNFDNALEISMSISGEHSVQVADTYHSIGRFYNTIGDYGTAEAYYQKAIQIYKDNLQNAGLLIAACYTHLADCYFSMGEMDKSKEVEEKALTIYETQLGEKSISSFTSYYNSLVLSCYRIGRCEDALSYAQKSVAYFADQECYQKAEAELLLGHVLKEEGQLDKAELHILAATDLNKKLNLDNTTYAISIYNYLADLYAAKGNHDAAIEAEKKELEVWQGMYPTETTKWANSYSDLGFYYLQKKDYALALENYQVNAELRQKRIDLAKALENADITYLNKDLAIANNNLSAVYEGKGDYPTAADYSLKAYTLLKNNGFEPSQTIKLWERLQRLHNQLAPGITFDMWLQQEGA